MSFISTIASGIFYRGDVLTTGKPTYYLWRSDFSTQEEFESAKERFTRIGFRVVTYFDGQQDNDIHIGIKTLIKNHWEDCRTES